MLADLYFPGWSAFVDGVKTPVLRVNHGLRGILLPPGSHDITMIFNSLTFQIGLWISLITSGILLAISFIIKLRNRLGFQ